MIIIPYQKDEQFTQEDFDFMCTVIAGKDRLAEGKILQTGKQNQKKLLANGITFLALSAFTRGFNPVFSYVLMGFGILFILIDLGCFSITKYGYHQIVDDGEIKGDIVFDEQGIHVWENSTKGFDASWDDLQYCYIAKLRIIILFRSQQQVIDMPYTPDNKDKVIAALKEGNKLSAVRLLNYEKGKISVKRIE